MSSKVGNKYAARKKFIFLMYYYRRKTDRPSCKPCICLLLVAGDRPPCELGISSLLVAGDRPSCELGIFSLLVAGDSLCSVSSCSKIADRDSFTCSNFLQTHKIVKRSLVT